ncbi:MAG: peptidoglycan DD-metalloendopeptidase family protein [Clostridium sp.]
MKKRVLKALVIGVVLVMGTNVTYAFATNTPTQSQIDANKDKMKELSEEQQKIAKEIAEQAGLESEQQKKLDAALADVKVYQDKIDKLQGDINTIENNVVKSKSSIEEKEKLILEKKKLAEEASDVMDLRVRSYYKTGGASEYLFMILESDGISEVFQNIATVSRLISLDKDLMDECEKIEKDMKKQIDLVNAELEKLEADKADLEMKKGDIVDAQKEFIDIKDKEQSAMDDLKRIKSAKQAKEDSLKGQIESLDLVTEQMQDELDRIMEESNASNKPSNPGSDTSPSVTGFARPVNGPVTSPFGYRIHPITGNKTFHKGVDFGNSRGTPIKASKGGTVSHSGWISGYGNTIIINHGDGQQTLYAHADSLSVSVGQSVSQGQEVAKVGSTGNSTGPHLHFEIRINGECVDPMKYL